MEPLESLYMARKISGWRSHEVASVRGQRAFDFKSVEWRPPHDVKARGKVADAKCFLKGRRSRRAAEAAAKALQKVLGSVGRFMLQRALPSLASSLGAAPGHKYLAPDYEAWAGCYTNIYIYVKSYI